MSIKSIRASLVAQGLHFEAANALAQRCGVAWGGNCVVTEQGICLMSGGALVIPRSEYQHLVVNPQYAPSGMRVPVVKVEVVRPEVKKVIEKKIAEVDPLVCKECGKRMPSAAALKGHMKKHG